MKYFYRWALTCCLISTSLACETTEESEIYLLCRPELDSFSEGQNDDGQGTLTIRGRHLQAYNSAVDPLLDIAVQVGTSPASVDAIDGPNSLAAFEPLDGDSSAANSDSCDACTTCVYASAAGCQDCQAECQFCVSDVTVVIPDGQGLAKVRIYNSMGQSNELDYWYPEVEPTPTAVPETPTVSATPTAAPGTPTSALPTTPPPTDSTAPTATAVPTAQPSASPSATSSPQGN